MNISLVSYLNSYPFHYGLIQANNHFYQKLKIVNPAQCAKDFMSSVSNTALVPVGALRSLKEHRIIKPYCIAANGFVKSVLLLSNKPLNEIQSISLDNASRSSNILLQVLCREYWNINPIIISNNSKSDASLIIGDKALTDANKYAFNYDLAEEWKLMSGLPFVFAVWLSSTEEKTNKEDLLNNALSYGVNHIEDAISFFGTAGLSKAEATKYLKENIVYQMDSSAEEAINLFLRLAVKISGY